MKTVKLAILLVTLISISYLLSCDMNKNSVVDNSVGNTGKSETDTQSECNAPANKCPLPSYCDNSKGVHFCLSIYDGNTKEVFNYLNIKTVRVIHSGYDCDNVSYYCDYVISGSNPTDMGCVLPWCSSYCIYTRTVCLETYDNETYTGSVTFGYDGYSGCEVDVYPSSTNCDFGGIERNAD
jgi:hypothetical protein